VKKLLYILAFITLSCASSKTSNVAEGSRHTRTIPVVMIDKDTYLLTVASTDKTYGYNQNNPVKVGGGFDGPQNERRFLNALFGPNNKKMMYHRVGSCCPFNTPNGYGGLGMLDKYRLAEIGSKDTIEIYINMYDEGNLEIPVGLTAKKKP
jgi:hypothetical protein